LNSIVRNLLFVPLICAVLYGIVGPPIGSLAISIPWIFSGESVDPIGSIGVAAFFSYIYGIKPAIFSGFVAGLIVQKLRLPIFLVISGLIGAASSFTYMSTWRFYHDIFAYGNFWVAIENMAIPGFVGGVVMGSIAFICFQQPHPAQNDSVSNQSAGV